jgi:hypothetical protein
MIIFGEMIIYGSGRRHKGSRRIKRGTAPHCAIGGSNPNGIESLRRAAPHGTHEMRSRGSTDRILSSDTSKLP